MAEERNEMCSEVAVELEARDDGFRLYVVIRSDGQDRARIDWPETFKTEEAAMERYRTVVEPSLQRLMGRCETLPVGNLVAGRTRAEGEQMAAKAELAVRVRGGVEHLQDGTYRTFVSVTSGEREDIYRSAENFATEALALTHYQTVVRPRLESSIGDVEAMLPGAVVERRTRPVRPVGQA